MTTDKARELLAAKLKQHERMIRDARNVLGDLAWDVGALLIKIEKQEGASGVARAVRDMPDSALTLMARSFVADLLRSLLVDMEPDHVWN